MILRVPLPYKSLSFILMSFFHVKELGCWRRYISKRLFEIRFPEFRISVFCVKHKASTQNIRYKYIHIKVIFNLIYMDFGLKQALSSSYIRCLEYYSWREKEVWFHHEFWQAFKQREYLVRTGRVAMEWKCFLQEKPQLFTKGQPPNPSS